MTPTTATMTEEYLALKAKNLIPDLVKGETVAHTWALRTLAAGLLMTYFHVALFLMHQPGFGVLAFVFPLVLDSLMIQLFHILTLRALNLTARLLALIGALVFGTASFALNWTAAQSPLSRWCFAGIVGGCIFVKIVVSVMGLSTAAMAKHETKTAPAAPAKPQPTAAQIAGRQKAKATIAAKAEQRKPNAASAPGTTPPQQQRRTPKPTPASAPGTTTSGLIIPSLPQIAQLITS